MRIAISNEAAGFDEEICLLQLNKAIDEPVYKAGAERPVISYDPV
jgi:hypothetical protein